MSPNGRIAAVGLALAVGAHPAFAWGVKGHQWAVQNAVELLPEGPLKASLQGQVQRIAYYTLLPDFQWKDGTRDKLEGPDHYLNLEVTSATPQASDLPRTRLEAARLYTSKGLKYRDGGFLPWRIEEAYWALVNALKTDPGEVAFYAGVLGHYAADATQPLHTTVHYDGRVDPRSGGARELKGIHLDYEVTFLEDHGLEFRQSSLKLAKAPQVLPDVHAAAVATILDSFGHVDELYEVARRHPGPGKYAAWDREVGELTRRQLAKAATFLTSLWLTAWQEAGRPDLSRPTGDQ